MMSLSFSMSHSASTRTVKVFGMDQYILGFISQEYGRYCYW